MLRGGMGDGDEGGRWDGESESRGDSWHTKEEPEVVLGEASGEMLS